MEARGGHVDTDRWVAFMLAELASRAGDYAEAARCCEAVLAAIADNAAPWWQSLRAQVKARLAVVVLGRATRNAARSSWARPLDAAAAWREHPALAAVLDACAVYVLSRDQPGAGGRAAAAEQAARLLGAAHGVRGVFDESSLDAPPARAQARAALGPEAFAAAYESALASSGYESAIALARELAHRRLARELGRADSGQARR